MSKSLKFKNNNYLDSTGIVHNRALLSAVLEKMVSNEDAIKSVDIDTINKTCYNYCNQCINTPTSTNGYLFTHRYRDDYIYQKYTTIYGASYERVKNAGVWRSWIKTSPIEIIETITNENGTALKFSDGTMICRATITHDVIDCSTQYGSAYYTETQWNFPVAFIEPPEYVNGVINWGGIGGVTANVIGTEYARFFVYNMLNFTGYNRKMLYIATGKWK